MRLYSILLAITFAFASPALAAEQHTVTMTGHGSVSAMPDQAVVSAGVVSQGRTAADAVSANAAAMNRVIAALARMKIAGKMVQTTGFTLEPQYPPENARTPARHTIIGYEVANSVSVILDDVTRAGAVLDAVIDAGANQSAGVSFNIKNDKPLLAVARAQAAQDARTRADAYAKALGAQLGPVLTIQEGGGVIAYAGVPDIITQDKPGTPIQASEQTVEAMVTVVWSLK